MTTRPYTQYTPYVRLIHSLAEPLHSRAPCARRWPSYPLHPAQEIDPPNSFHQYEDDADSDENDTPKQDAGESEDEQYSDEENIIDYQSAKHKSLRNAIRSRIKAKQSGQTKHDLNRHSHKLTTMTIHLIGKMLQRVQEREDTRCQRSEKHWRRALLTRNNNNKPADEDLVDDNIQSSGGTIKDQRVIPLKSATHHDAEESDVEEEGDIPPTPNRPKRDSSPDLDDASSMKKTKAVRKYYKPQLFDYNATLQAAEEIGISPETIIKARRILRCGS